MARTFVLRCVSSICGSVELLDTPLMDANLSPLFKEASYNTAYRLLQELLHPPLPRTSKTLLNRGVRHGSEKVCFIYCSSNQRSAFVSPCRNLSKEEEEVRFRLFLLLLGSLYTCVSSRMTVRS